MAEWAELVRGRKMTRAFRPDPIRPELIDTIIADAARAPSAGKVQGWHAIVLRDDQTHRFWDATLPEPKRATFAWPDLLSAPIVMTIAADPAAYLERYSEPDKQHTGLGASVERWPSPYWTVDASMAAMCILFGAQAVGLGALFFGIFNGESELRRELGIPKRIELIGAIAIGHRVDGPQRRGRSAARPVRTPEQIIHESHW